MLKRSLIVLSASASLAGCMATPPLRDIAVDTNRLVAETANDQTVLNILRAKDRMPMHFTSFTVLRGNLSVEAGASLELGIPGADSLTENLDGSGVVTSSAKASGATTATPNLSAKIAANPNFELAVYDTKQFEQGILTPVSDGLIEYYLQNGWPEDFLTALFVSRIDIKVEEKTQATIVNEAGSTKFKQFLTDTRMVPSTVKGSVTPLMLLSQFNDGLSLSDIDKLDGKKFDVADNPDQTHVGTYIVRKKADSASITFDGIEEVVRPFVSKELLGFDPANLKCLQVKSLLEAGSLSCTEKGVSSSKKVSVEVYLRSPEAILYFLGSYVRCDLASEEDRQPCAVYTLGDGAKLIEIKHGAVKDALFTVNHRGETYSISEPQYTDDEPKHRGSQAIVLVQQLVNLQKSADDLPSSSSIKIAP